MGEGGSIPKIKQYHFKICKSEVIIIKTIKINFKFQMLNFSQRAVNSLDKEIADIEKKKSMADKKCAEIQGKVNLDLCQYFGQ